MLENASVEITGLAHGGYGVGRIDGQVCFVRHALPGDVVQVKDVTRTKGLLWAEIAHIVEPSPDRKAAQCPMFGRCGGCSWLHFAYPAQGEWKRRIVADCLKRIARVETEPEWVEDSDLRTGYRTRAEFHCDAGRWGFFEAGSHKVVPISECALCHPRLNAALGKLGGLRLRDSVDLTVNPDGDEVLVWTRRRNPALTELFPVAAETCGELGRTRFMFDGVPIVAGAFSQSSLLLNRLLVGVTTEYVGEAKQVLDLYCGNGNFSLGLARSGAEVLGVDHNAAAVQSAASLGLGEYRVGDESTFRDALESGWDVVVLDPPRTGAKTVMPALATRDTGAIVYVSCDPATLARDVGTLVASGWRVIRVAAVDMFPNTPHVETVCRLERV